MASTASVSDWERFDRSCCANCELFGWDQLDPRSSPLRRCTGCRKIYYCSKECQEEHWHKVHRRHCKLFAGQKGLEGTVVHEKETCNHCIMQEAAGQEVFKDKNPNYICFFDPKNLRAKSLLELQLRYPLPVEETPQNRVDKIIDLLQILLLKIKLTKQSVYRLYPGEVDAIAAELCHLKMKISIEGVTYPRNYQAPVGLTEIKTLLSLEYLRSILPSGRYQMWHTFLIVFDLLYCVRTIQLDGMIKNPEKSLPKDQRQMSRMVRGGSYLRVVDQILELLEQRVASQKDLAVVVCEGNVQRVCSGCKKGITVKVVSTAGVRIEGMPAVMFQSGQDNLFSCGAKACEDLMDVRPEVDAWHFAVWATANKLRETRCDNCFLLAPVKEVHRLATLSLAI